MTPWKKGNQACKGFKQAMEYFGFRQKVGKSIGGDAQEMQGSDRILDEAWNSVQVERFTDSSPRRLGEVICKIRSNKNNPNCPYISKLRIKSENRMHKLDVTYNIQSMWWVRSLSF